MKILFFCIITLLVLPAVGRKSEGIEVVIEIGKSYKYDLSKGVYSVLRDGGYIQIKFTLTEEEIYKIRKMYYSLYLNKLPRSIIFKDNCTVMPKKFTKLFVNAKGKSQVISIDNNCNSFGLSERSKAARVKKYLLYIKQIMEVKKEIKEAPKSDYIYM